jgi:hypothetical protein
MVVVHLPLSIYNLNSIRIIHKKFYRTIKLYITSIATAMKVNGQTSYSDLVITSYVIDRSLIESI